MPYIPGRPFWFAGWGAFLLAILGLVLGWAWDQRSLALGLTTLQVVALTALWSVPLGVLLSWLLTRSDMPGRWFALLLLVLWMFLPLYLQASAWDAGFGQQGWFSQWTGQTAEPMLRGMLAVIFIHGLAALPWIVLLTSLGMQQNSRDLEELAEQDGSTWQVLWLVTLPLSAPAILAAAIWTALTIAGEMTVTDLYRVRTYAEELYTNFALTADATEATIGLAPQALLLALFTCLAWQLAMLLAPAADRAAWRDRQRVPLGRGRWPVAAVILLTLSAATFVPLANLVYKAGFTVDTRSGQPVRTWTTATFINSTFPNSLDPRSWECGTEYATTLLLSAGVATLTLLVATPLAWWSCRRRLGAGITISLIVFGLAIPGPLVGIGVIELFNRPDANFIAWLYDRTLIPTILAVAVRTLPLGLFVLWYSFRSIASEQIESAQIDGATTAIILKTIVLPQRWVALAITWLGSFAIAAGDLSANILVAPPGQITLANHIFLLIHAGVHNEEAGLCLTQVALFGGIALAILGLARQASREP